MSITQRVKRSLVLGAAGAMVLSLLPAGIAAADVIETDGLAACEGSEGLVEFNDTLGFFSGNIECMAAYGVTVGDADNNFNSTDTVTRQQMALFIARLAAQALNGNTDIPESTDDAFDDIADVNPAEARDAINFLASLDIVEGDGEGAYNPGGIVSRQQMASFVARAHVALEVDFTGFEATAGVFGDEDEIAAVHLDNVNLLADVGVVEGDVAGDYNPGNPVTRGQMSAFVVRSIALLDGQGLWNGVFVPTGDEAEFTVVFDGLFDNTTANTTDDREDLGDDENLIALSDGSAVTIFQFSVTEDDFFIDGSAATASAFLNEVVVGAEFSVTETATGFAHDISSSPADVLEGTVGNGDGTDFALVDEPSGVSLLDLTAAIAEGQLYTVDGVAVNEATFFSNLSIGDSLEAEVLSTDAAGDPESFRHNLTNGSLEGTVVATDGGALAATVDVNTDDDADIDTIANLPLYVTTDGTEADVTFIVDGDEVDAVGDLNDDLTTGDVLTYSKVDGDTTFELVNSTPPAVEATVASFVADTSVTLADGTVVTLADVDVFRVNGSIASEDDYDAEVSVGDLVTYQEGDAPADVDEELWIVDTDLNGDVTAVDTGGLDVDVDVVGGAIATLEVDAAPAGYAGADLRYFVDGDEVADAATFVAEIDTALGDEDTVTLTVTGTSIATSFSVTTS